MVEGRNGRFPTTHWSIVLGAGNRETQASRDSLQSLCKAYWYPVYLRVRRTEQNPETARDLTQGFFADLLERGNLEAADPDRGRFRCFLTVLLKNFLSNEVRRATALKRGGGTRAIALDLDEAETQYRREPAHEETPEVLFERAWARTLLARALDRVRAEHVGPPAAERFRRLEPFLTGDGWGKRYREIAEALEITEAAVKTAVHRLRRRFGEVLRAEVRETVRDPDLVDDEIRHLVSVLST